MPAGAGTGYLDVTGLATSADRRAAIQRQYQPLLDKLRAAHDAKGEQDTLKIINARGYGLGPRDRQIFSEYNGRNIGQLPGAGVKGVTRPITAVFCPIKEALLSR